MAVAADRESVRSRNATERAILDAASHALAEEHYEKLTMDAIAKRAFVSRTAVYFYFDNKRALMDRLIQRAFADMYEAAMIYLDGRGEPRRELRLGLSRTVAVVNRDQHVLLLAAKLSGQEGGVLPLEWQPYITRFVQGATKRIARDQQRGLAPLDIPPRLSAQALLAMVENHLIREVVLGGGDANESIRVLAELWWRAVYAQPSDISAAHTALVSRA
jgi:AcrR family transcriptional regulator